jgi:hypothetical protein
VPRFRTLHAQKACQHSWPPSTAFSMPQKFDPFCRLWSWIALLETKEKKRSLGGKACPRVTGNAAKSLWDSQCPHPLSRRSTSASRELSVIGYRIEGPEESCPNEIQ